MKMPIETLHTCPDCKQPGFTEKGLKSHRGNKTCADRQKAGSPATERAIALGARTRPVQHGHAIVISDLGEDAEMSSLLTEQYHRATGGMVEVLKFGAMMIQLEAALSAREQGSGNGRKGDGVKGWLERHAPGINRATAYRLKAVAESVSEEYEKIVGAKVAKQFSLPALATAEPEKLPEAARVKQMDLFDFVRGTSQRSWLDRFKPPAKVGGKTYERQDGKGQRREPTPEEAAALLRTVCQNAAQHLATVHKEKAFTVLNDAELDGLANHCEEVLGQLKAWRKLTQAERAKALGQHLTAQLEGRK